MINQICESLTNKIRQEMPDIDDEEAEVIKYGLELIIGEVPKILLLFIIAIVLKIGWLVTIQDRCWWFSPKNKYWMYNWNTFYLLWKCFNK